LRYWLGYLSEHSESWLQPPESPNAFQSPFDKGGFKGVLRDTPSPGRRFSPALLFCHSRGACPRGNGERESSRRAGRKNRNPLALYAYSISTSWPETLSQPVFARSRRRRGNLGEGRLLRLPLAALGKWLAMTNDWVNWGGHLQTPGGKYPAPLLRQAWIMCPYRTTPLD
jgi:hypothetical protein